MKLLMTADTVGGVWTYALALAHGLCRRGVEVHVASMGRLPDAAQRAAAQRIPGLVLHTSAFRLCWMVDPWDDLEQAGTWLTGLARAIRPDLIHLNDFGHAAMDWPAPALLVAHSCVLSWWQAVYGEPAPAQWQRYRRLVCLGLERAASVVAPSHAMAAALDEQYPVRRSVRVIPNGLTPHRPAALWNRAPLILSAGRLWDEAKNLRALATVAPDLPWPVVVAGDKPAAGNPGRADNLVLPGRLTPDQLALHYARASIFALPARYEPFGLAALEAAAYGCALVLGDIASLRELWDGAALFVPPDEPARLREALLRLIHDPMLRQHYAARAASRATRFSLHAMTGRYLSVYGELTGSATVSRTA